MADTVGHSSERFWRWSLAPLRRRQRPSRDHSCGFVGMSTCGVGHDSQLERSVDRSRRPMARSNRRLYGPHRSMASATFQAVFMADPAGQPVARTPEWTFMVDTAG